jgi:hypothetical protein
MSAHLAVMLEAALHDLRALSLGETGDPLRLDLPPDQVDGAGLEPRSAGVLGTLYLLSELEQAQVVPCAELLAAERWTLELRDDQSAAALERFAENGARWPPAAQRAGLYGRLFGASGGDLDRTPTPGRHAVDAPPVAVLPPPVNAAFEELLAGYCEAIVQVQSAAYGRATATLRLAGDRLRANLAPRQFGNTLVVAAPLVEQLQAALNLLGQAGITGLLHVRTQWDVVRALTSGGVDIGRHLDRGQAGRTLIGSCGYPPVPDLFDAALVQAAHLWLTATGFDSTRDEA